MSRRNTDPDSVIILAGEVDEPMVGSFMERLLELETRKRGITVRITSHGGCAGSGFAIYDAIKHARNHVTTEAWGMAESSAALIFQAGHTRLMAPSARLLFHDIQSDGSTTTGSRGINARAKDIRAVERMYMQSVATRARLDPKVVEKWCNDITAFSANEAVDKGLADGIIGDPR